jgi:predicted phosphodiesterase
VASKKIDLTEFYRTRAVPSSVDREDIDVLCKLVMKRKPVAPISPVGEKVLLVLLSDWQAGKNEGGGSEALAERVIYYQDALIKRLKDLRKTGKAVSTVYLIGLGDLIEQCSGHYAMQTATTDLDRREQMRLVRRLILRMIDLLVDAGYSVVLGAVPGNHGENRNAFGKAYTTWTDNDDLAIFDGVAEVMSHNPERYKNVEVPLGAIAEDLTMTLDLAGVKCGFAHGHMFRNGSNKNWVKTNGSVGKIESWWLGQAMGRQPIANADILFCGHLHHFVASGATGRYVFMSPAADGGSHWYTSTTGNNHEPGMLTMLIGTGCGTLGWSDLQIL